MNRLLQTIAANFTMNAFKPYKQSEAFDIYHHLTEPRIELAILRKMSTPHYHQTAGAKFLFMDANSVLQLGDPDDQNCAKMVNISAKPGAVYSVPARKAHAAGPRNEGTEIRLLILNDVSQRERNSSAYPDDTIAVTVK